MAAQCFKNCCTFGRISSSHSSTQIKTWGPLKNLESHEPEMFNESTWKPRTSMFFLISFKFILSISIEFLHKLVIFQQSKSSPGSLNGSNLKNHPFVFTNINTNPRMGIWIWKNMLKIGVPQNGWFIMVPNPIKIDVLGEFSSIFEKWGSTNYHPNLGFL